MITQMIFDWAKQTPNRTAVIYNDQRWSYRSFAQFIALSRGYFARRGYIGPGYAVLALHNLMDFWVLSLALRSLGLTTLAVPSVAEVARVGLPNVRCVITSPGETWAGLDGLCTELGLPLLSLSLASEPALAFEVSEAPHPVGGHILRTSGTTGIYKMVLMSPAFDAVLLRRRAELFGMNKDTVFCVFDFPPWTGAGYKWAASPWSVGGANLIEQGRERDQALLHPGITHAVLTPGMLVAVLAAPAGAFPRNDTMQLAVSGGAMTRMQVDQAKARITPRLFNDLGCTEAGTIAFTSLDTPEDQRWHRLVPSRVVEIVDESDHPVPTGETGRLRVGTDGGPTSYLNDETATRAFFKNGFFYPGDLAVMRSDGRPPDKLMPGMRLAKPIMNKGGMVLLGEGTELTETWIMRIQDMELEEQVYVEGKQEMEVPLDEMLAALETRFRTPEESHRMEIIKRAAERHIRSLYE